MTTALRSLLLLPLAGCAVADDGPLPDRVAAIAATPRATSGLLTEPSHADPDAIVRAYLARDPRAATAELEPARVRAVGHGAVVALRQRHQGLRVIGGLVTGRTDELGRLRWLRDGAVAMPPALDLAPTVTEAQIRTRLATDPRLAGRPLAGAEIELVVFALGAHAAAPRLAWQVALPFDPGRGEALLVFADARDAGILSLVDRIRRAAGHRARVFPSDPLTTPDLVEVTLDRLPADATTLDDDAFDVYTCLDRRECTTLEFDDTGPQALHFCSFDKLATTSAAGDFLAVVPPDDHTTPDDAFAEVQAYHHLHRALGFVRERLGQPDLLADVRYTVVTNAPGQFMGTPDPAACTLDAEGNATVVPDDSVFTPLENAAFGPLHTLPGMPAPIDQPTMFFGQGVVGDFAYGGDVAYHEFGHGMFHFIGNRETGAKRVRDELGIDTSPGAMDEAFADALAFMITGEPILGRYAVGNAEGFRTAANEKTCPTDLDGEEHDDSEPWSGALWSIREGLTEEERPRFDRAVLTTMMAITDADDFRSVSELLVTEIAIAMGDSVAARANTELTRRGFTTACNDRVRELASGESHAQLFALEPGPAPIQFGFELTSSSETIALRSVAVPIAEAVPTATLHLKQGGAIRWDWSTAVEGGGPTSDADVKVPVSLTADENNPGVLAVSAVAEGYFAAGHYTAQLEVHDAANVVFFEVSFGRAADDGKGDDLGDGDGGGCRAAGGGGLGLVLLALVGALRRRRR